MRKTRSRRRALLVAIFDLIPLVGATVERFRFRASHSRRGVRPTAASVAVVVLVLYQQFENRVLQQLVYHRTVDLAARDRAERRRRP